MSAPLAVPRRLLARDRPVVCFAHVTNQMAQVAGDFEKGPGNGVDLTLALAVAVATGVNPD